MHKYLLPQVQLWIYSCFLTMLLVPHFHKSNTWSWHISTVLDELCFECQLLLFKTICFEITVLQGTLLGLNQKQITTNQTVNDNYEHIWDYNHFNFPHIPSVSVFLCRY